MSEKSSPEQTLQFWKQQAKKYGQSPSASWSDRMVIEMEIRQIMKYLEDGDHVLDVGCANGYSTLQYATQKRITMKGIDIIPEMIANANLRLQEYKTLSGRLEFSVGDITSLNEPGECYNKVIVTRVLINLGSWENQSLGIRECIRVLKRGGMLLLSEATIQGWQNLNKFRKEWGLPDIPMPSFNEYLDQEQVIRFASPDLKLVELVNFASTYYVGTRVLKPLLANALKAGIDIADPNMELNRWFAELPSFGDYGTQKLFVFEKR